MRPLLLSALLVASLQAEPRISLGVGPDAINVTLTGASGSGPWLLEHSVDGQAWEPLQLFGENGDGSVQPNLEVPLNILADPGSPDGFFRAVQLEEDNLFLRRFLDERTTWRLSNTSDYRIELTQWFGWTSWRGIINVRNGVISSYRTLERYPAVFDDPQIPTIDDLFDRLADAIARDAYAVTVSWDKPLGYPLTGYIDLDDTLADEEQGWTIHSFSLLP